MHAATGSTYFSRRHHLALGLWGQKVIFSESSHFAYQINGNGAWSTMQAHILSLHIPSTPGVESKGQNIFF